MFLSNRYSVFLFVLLALILGSLASANTASDIWYQNLVKSNLNPPGYIFGIVWPILYVLMSISAFRTFESTKKLFIIQLILNTAWSWLFFSLHVPIIALINIFILISINIKIFLMMFVDDKLSAGIYLPYILWLLFASYLNAFIVFNN